MENNRLLRPLWENFDDKFHSPKVIVIASPASGYRNYSNF
jgi:hypothetical protein